MKILLTIIFLSLLSSPSWSVSYDDKYRGSLLTQFKTIESDILSGEIKATADEYAYLGMAYLNGFFRKNEDGAVGYTYVDLEKNAEKAFTYQNKASQLGNETSTGLLGMFFLNGIGCKKDLNKAIELLRPLRLFYSDIATAYGLAVHEQIRSNTLYATDKNIQAMIGSLKYAAQSNEIAALNALYQIYNEGRFVNKDENLANQYSANAKKHINEKIKLQEAITDARGNISNLNSTLGTQEKIIRRNQFIAAFGLLASVYFSYQPTYTSNNNVCTVGCSPPSVLDLINWGIL